MCQEWEGGKPVGRRTGYFPRKFAGVDKIQCSGLAINCFILNLIFISAEVHDRHAKII